MSRNTAEYPSQPVSTANLTESEQHSLLSSERRRIVLEYFDGQVENAQLADVACAVATRESGLDATDSEAVRQVKVTLHHNHLPKMDELGVITYDPCSGHISV